MFRIRIGNDAGPGLDEGLVLFDDDGSDVDAHVHVAGETEVPHRAGIGPSPGRLEFIDDLHRANLRRAGDRTGRETSPQHVVRGLRVIQLPCHIRDDVHDVRIPLDVHE